MWSPGWRMRRPAAAAAGARSTATAISRDLMNELSPRGCALQAGISACGWKKTWIGPGPLLLECVRCPGVGGADSKAGPVARRCHSALGLTRGQAPWRHADNDTAREQRTVHHQGQYREERHAHLPRAGRAVLRADANQYIERGAVVLHRGRSPGGRVAALKAVARFRPHPRLAETAIGVAGIGTQRPQQRPDPSGPGRVAVGVVLEPSSPGGRWCYAGRERRGVATRPTA